MARKMLVLYAVMAASAVLLQVAFGGSVGALFAPAPAAPGAPQVDVAIGVGFGLLVVLLSRVASERLRWARKVDAEFRELMRPLSPRDVPGLAVMSALAEELFFRGFLQPRLGLVFTSLVFGLAHLPRDRALVPWTVAAIVMGFAFGWMMETRGTLLAPILAHFTINFFNLHQLLRPRVEETA